LFPFHPLRSRTPPCNKPRALLINPRTLCPFAVSSEPSFPRFEFHDAFSSLSSPLSLGVFLLAFDASHCYRSFRQPNVSKFFPRSFFFPFYCAKGVAGVCISSSFVLEVTSPEMFFSVLFLPVPVTLYPLVCSLVRVTRVVLFLGLSFPFPPQSFFPPAIVTVFYPLPF